MPAPRRLIACAKLLGSMRFAISLLGLIAIAAVIGTVLPQNRPAADYARDFGHFWFGVFDTLGLYDVYHGIGFLSLLALLLLSTSVCLWRTTPGALRAMHSFREHASRASLASMRYSQRLDIALTPERVQQTLHRARYRVRRVQHTDGTLILAARRGSYGHTLGYVWTHAAIVVICLGALFDSNLPLKWAQWRGTKVPETREIAQGQVPSISRLSADAHAFRGEVSIREKHSADVLFINAGQGYFVQELPFIIALERFFIEYYANGMPKQFASDVRLIDKANGHSTRARIAVNQPFNHHGITLYQSSFSDGGSPLRLSAWALNQPQMTPIALHAHSLTSQFLTVAGQRYYIQFLALRPFNLQENDASVVPDFMQQLAKLHQLSATTPIQNLGPSIDFSLRDAQGQTRIYRNYLAPMMLDGQGYLLSGVRNSLDAPLRYIRFPLDDAQSLTQYMRFKSALQTPSLYNTVARATTQQLLAKGKISRTQRPEIEEKISRLLAQLAQHGVAGLTPLWTETLPISVMDIVLNLLNSAQATPRPANAGTQRFISDSLAAYSASLDEGTPVLLQLIGFDLVHASGLQITRAPGQAWVYGGVGLLLVGLFCLFYLRECRVWVVCNAHNTCVSMSASRTDDTLDAEFKQLQQDLVRAHE